MCRNNSVAVPERPKFLSNASKTDFNLHEQNIILVLLTVSYFSLILSVHPPSSSGEHFPSAEQCDWLSLSSFVAVSNFPNGTRASKITKKGCYLGYPEVRPQINFGENTYYSKICSAK